MIRLMFLSVLNLFVALAQAVEPAPEKTPPPAFTAQPCDFGMASAALAARLQCGTLKVHSADGSTFQLAVVRKAALEPKAGAAPVLYLHGGPGGEMTRYTGMSEADFVPGHELIAIDMRGSGRSRPLFCPELSATLRQVLAQSPDDSSLQQQRRDALLKCQQQMLAQGYSPADFGTVQTVRDLELLREQLDIDKWHLYSISYGTVVALHYLASAPQAIASVTLDSVYPPDELLTSFKLQQDQWLRQLDQLCQQQAGCVQRYGSMPELFNRALARVSQSPLQITAAPHSLLLTPDKLRLAVMATATAEQPLSLLALWLEAVSQGNAALLQPWAEALQTPEPLQFAAAMATECADRKRFYQAGRADGLEQLFGLPDGVCAAFGLLPEQLQVPQVPETAKVRTPVLLLAGGLDLFQPDALVLSQWLGPHSQLVAVPWALHGVRGPQPCLRKMVGDFIRAPQRFGPPACLAQVGKPYLVSAVELNPVVAKQAKALATGQFSAAIVALAVALGLSAILGVIWPLSAAVWRWFRAQAQPEHRPDVLSGLAILLALASWGGLILAMLQTLERYSAELWLGLPPDTQFWRLLIAVSTLPSAALIWWLARQHCWRPLVAQAAVISAALLALALHLLP